MSKSNSEYFENLSHSTGIIDPLGDITNSEDIIFDNDGITPDKVLDEAQEYTLCCFEKAMKAFKEDNEK